MSKFTYAMTKTACLYCHQNGSRTQLCECDFLLWNWSAFESTAIKHGAWCMVYGMWYMVCGMVYGIQCKVYGIWCNMHGVWCMVHIDFAACCS